MRIISGFIGIFSYFRVAENLFGLDFMQRKTYPSRLTDRSFFTANVSLQELQVTALH